MNTKTGRDDEEKLHISKSFFYNAGKLIRIYEEDYEFRRGYRLINKLAI